MRSLHLGASLNVDANTLINSVQEQDKQCTGSIWTLLVMKCFAEVDGDWFGTF